MLARVFCLMFAVLLCDASMTSAQPLGQPDRGQPGDEMIQAYLKQETDKIAAKWADDVKSLEQWQGRRPQYVEEYYYMLGLSPRPEKTPLKATITGKVEGDGYVVENLHYQSVPRLYVTGNLYRPAKMKEGEKLPAVFYVCGHSGRGRNGNKVAFQSHGIWFARHGYVCLIVDTLQLGEIAATHHGTYNLNRWWWHSRGYTPAGVECWNGVRGIDYLISRDDVDPERIAVTGISGGGAATFWIAAADERVAAAVPVSGMADLEAYVPNRVINGHCDCMFMYNTFQWPWTRIAALVAPRPLLFVNSDNDAIFPMDANDRIQNRLERLYSLYGAGDQVDAVVSVGGHAYRKDIREAEYRFINSHLKGDARAITDSEQDVVSEGGNPGTPPIPPEKLRVFPTDDDLPKDQLNTTIDEHFVPMAKPDLPEKGTFEEWKTELREELRRVSFWYFPKELPAAKEISRERRNYELLETEPGVFTSMFLGKEADLGKETDLGGRDVLLAVLNNDDLDDAMPGWIGRTDSKRQFVSYLESRGIGETRWTRKNGPNYVERSHVLLGRTVDSGRVWDVIAAAKRWTERRGAPKTFVAGKGSMGILAAYAAALDDSVAGVTLVDPPTSHMDNAAPQFLNALRVCDIPDALGLIAPRPLTIITDKPEAFERTKAIYEAAGAGEKLKITRAEK
jgi:cephalosporin-C deacetylase-like acetyl esterase